ncbi:MAG: hypothetical protein L3J44_06725 [Campylobacteraceae bacterium]|nr:hypothetical protein [Campylobacteraceae bacterium]
MRIFGYIISFLVVLFAIVYMLLFTNGGNNLLKPYVKKTIEKKLNQKIVINSMILKPNFVDFEIIIDERSKIVINGDFNLFDKSFNLIYKMNLTNLKTPYIYIKNRVIIDGVMKGNIENYDINGKGKLFRADVKFLISMSKKTVKSLKIDARHIRPEEVFSLIKKPIYTQGMLDINANLISSDGVNFNGVAKSNIYYGILNNDVIKSEFGIEFGSAVTYKGKINSTIKNGIINSSGEIFSNLAKLKFNNSKFDIKTKDFDTSFTLKVPNLQALKPLIKQTLIGSAKFNAKVIRKDKILSAKIVSKKFGGNIVVMLTDRTVNINFANLRSQDIFKMLGGSRYFSSKIDGEIEITDISKFLPISDIRVSEGHFYTLPMQELMGVRLPTNNNFSAHINSFVNDDNLSIKTDFVSNIFNFKSKDVNLDLNTSQYNGKYVFNVEKLANISFLTNRKLRGKLNIVGNFEGKKDTYKVEAQSKFLDANNSLVLKDGILDANISNLQTSKLLYTVYLPEIFDSNADVNITYDLFSKKGNFFVKAMNGKLRKGELSDLVFSLTKYDLTNDFYDDTTLKGDIDKNIISLDFIAKSKNSEINITKATINTKTQQIDSSFSVKAGEKDINGKIKGTIEKPKIDIKSSQYIKNKIEKIIDKKVPENLKVPIKNLLNLFG